jgi:hypothetical protein
MTAWSIWSFFQKGKLLAVPHTIVYPNGLQTDVGPLRIFDLGDKAVALQITETLLTDNVEKVNNYNKKDDAREERKKVLKLFKVKSEKQFAREVKLLTIERNSGRFDVELTVGQKNGSFLGDPELSASIPKAMSLEQTVDFLIDHFKQQSTP